MAEGATVVVAARKPDPGQIAELEKKWPSQVHSLALDMGSRSSIDDGIKRFEAMGLDLDILVNNAGLLTGGLFEEQPVSEVYDMFQVNLVGVAHLTARLLPGMLERKRGKIVMNSSVSAVMRFPCASTYAASKAGLMAMTEILEGELKGTGVSTLCVLTPGVQTRMFDEIPKKYGKNLDTKFLSQGISAEKWAAEIMEAIRDDREMLSPTGPTRAGLSIARHLPALFQSLARPSFRRD